MGTQEADLFRPHESLSVTQLDSFETFLSNIGGFSWEHFLTHDKAAEYKEMGFSTVFDTYAFRPVVQEGYSLAEHTQMVSGQYNRYFTVDPMVRFFLYVHDIGKPTSIVSSTHQHPNTIEALKSLYPALGISPETLHLHKELVDQDIIGRDYLRALKKGLPYDLNAIVRAITEHAESAGVSKAQYYKLLKTYYLCDAGSYTVNAGGKRSLDSLFESGVIIAFSDTQIGETVYTYKSAMQLLDEMVLG